MTFFSDHPMVRSGVLISIVSLLLSFGNFYYSISIQREQNRRWDALNINGVELIDTGFIIYKQISNQERTQTEWGYNPIALRFAKDRIISDKYQLPYELLLVKLPIGNANFERVPNSNYFFTIAEANKEIKRLGLQQGAFKIYKHLQIQFDFKNLGKTIAKDVRIRISGKDPQTGIEVTPFTQDETIDLLPDRGGSTTVPLWCPINEDLPKTLKFTASITYLDVHGKTQERSVPVIYDSKQNYWMYGH